MKSCDAFFVTNFYNILYLTDFKSLSPEEREAYVLVTKKKTYLFTDGRYLTKELTVYSLLFAVETKLITQEKNITQHLQEIIKQEKIERLGFESEDLKHQEFVLFKKKLPVRFIPTKNMVRQIRIVKDSQELATIEKACRLADDCLQDTRKIISVGMREREIAFKMEQWIKKRGYGLAFQPIIVAVDKNSSVPHYETGDGVVRKGSIILIDFGIQYNNYISDITRMFFMGKQSTEVVNAYSALRSAQEKTVTYLSENKTAKDIDLFCRSRLKGFPDYMHSTGHGVGLEIHEDPRLSFRSEDVLEDGNVFSVEPGVYIEGKWGMRVEDTVALHNGKPKILTGFTKEMIIL